MPLEIRLTADVGDGRLMFWRAQVGQRLEQGQVIAEIETDKAVLEVESPASGVLAVQVVAEGQRVRGGEVVAVLAGLGEDVATIQQGL